MGKKQSLLAGFAKTSITPPEPVGMNLHGMPRLYPGARGVLDPLYCRTCYLESGASRLLIMVLDLDESWIIDPVKPEVVETLSQFGKLQKENIWICTVHCHSSFGPGGNGPYAHKVLRRHLLLVKRRMVQAGKAAIRGKQPVSIGYGQAPVEGVTANRRIKLSDGTVTEGWGEGPTPPPGVRIVGRGPTDEDLGLVVFKDRRGKPVGVLVNFNSHIHLYPVLYFTSELPGAVCRGLEKCWPGSIAVYTNGAEGNTSVCSTIAPQSRDPRAWNRQYRRERKKLADRMVNVCRGIGNKMEFESKVRMQLDRTLVKIKNGKRGEAIEKLSAVTINNLAWLGQGEEMFVEFALKIKEQSPFTSTFVIGLKDELNFYFPTTAAIEEGGFEIQAEMEPGSLERVIGRGSSLLGRLHATGT